jgi:hypothetical protein
MELQLEDNGIKSFHFRNRASTSLLSSTYDNFLTYILTFSAGTLKAKSPSTCQLRNQYHIKHDMSPCDILLLCFHLFARIFSTRDAWCQCTLRKCASTLAPQTRAWFDQKIDNSLPTVSYRSKRVQFGFSSKSPFGRHEHSAFSNRSVSQIRLRPTRSQTPVKTVVTTVDD